MTDETTPAAQEQPALRPGFATSEFWFSLVTFLAGLLILFFGAPDLREYALAMMSGSGAVYAISRGIAKRGAA